MVLATYIKLLARIHCHIFFIIEKLKGLIEDVNEEPEADEKFNVAIIQVRNRKERDK